MMIGNRHQLDTEREALRDRFDEIWIASTSIGPKESRAIRCAIALDCRSSTGGWLLGPGWRGTAPAVIPAHGPDYIPAKPPRHPHPLHDAIDSLVALRQGFFA